VNALEFGHRETCPKVQHIRDYTRFAQEHGSFWTEIRTLFEAGNYTELLTHTARIVEMADFFLVTSAVEHDDANASLAILMFSHLGECNEWMLNMELALHFFTCAYKIQASVPAGGANEANRVPVMENLARTHRRIGEPEEANKLYMRIVQICPGGARKSWLYGQIARCTMDMGKFESALQWVAKAEQMVRAVPPAEIDDDDRTQQSFLQMDVKAQCFIGLRQYDAAAIVLNARIALCNHEAISDSIGFIRAHVMLVTATTNNFLQSQGRVADADLEHSETCLRQALLMCAPEYAQDVDYLRDTAKLQSFRCDVLLHLSFVLYKRDKKQEALDVLREMLGEYLLHQSHLCAYCKQGKDQKTARMHQCGRCRVVRFCGRKHQEMATARLATQNGKMVVPHSTLCRLLQDFRRKSKSLASLSDAESEEAQLKFLQTGIVGHGP